MVHGSLKTCFTGSSARGDDSYWFGVDDEIDGDMSNEFAETTVADSPTPSAMNLSDPIPIRNLRLASPEATSMRHRLPPPRDEMNFGTSPTHLALYVLMPFFLFAYLFLFFFSTAI